jgi:nitrous oxide reductase
MSQMNRRQFLRGSAMVAGAALLTACGAQGQPSTGNTGQTGQTGQDASTPQAEVAQPLNARRPGP